MLTDAAISLRIRQHSCHRSVWSAQAKLEGFLLVKGLLLPLVAGILSAVYGFALAAGGPVADVASAHGAGVFRGNVVYIFSNTGAFIATSLYCLWLHRKHKTLGEIVELPAGAEKASLPVNWAMALGLPRGRGAGVCFGESSWGNRKMALAIKNPPPIAGGRNLIKKWAAGGSVFRRELPYCPMTRRAAPRCSPEFSNKKEHNHARHHRHPFE